MSQKDSDKIGRQAVVIIHGIGEQRPMVTLRSFVDSISFWIKKGDRKRETRPRNWSRPDGISEIYETRRITMEHYDGNPKTDFYEFYWAHHMRNTSYSHLVPWLWKLLKTKTKDVPPRLKKVQAAARIIFIFIIAVIALFLCFGKPVIAYISLHWIRTAGLVALLTFIGRIVFWIVKVPFSQLLLNTAGDAARYFNPMPSNIGERSNIRREGIAFLKKLHERVEKPYDRIIVVGHSLGSVVAYDMIRLLWHEMHEDFSPTEKVSHDIFDEMEAIAVNGTVADIQKFQDLQHECWKQYRNNGNKWLISDFITCAGAIAHADFYLLNDTPFAELINRKEFPTCPPVMEGKDKTLFFDGKTFDLEDANHQPIKRTVKFLNHAAPFAITRWTNIYFTSDYVGGKSQRIFKQGVKDIEVKRKGWWLIPGGHTNYWEALMGNEALHQIACAIGFRQIKDADAD